MDRAIPMHEGRQPRVIVTANGQRVGGVEMVEGDNNNFYQADTWTVQLALSGALNGMDWQWWGNQPKVEIAIYGGFPANPDHYTQGELDLWVMGLVDDITIHPLSGSLELTGRDYTAAFIDAVTSEKFINQTSSQVAATLAKRHGLLTQITPTTRKVGHFYSYDHVHLTDSRSEWDLLCYLAREEGYDVFVRGKTLYFQPKADPKANPYDLRWSKDADGHHVVYATDIEFERNLTLAKDVVVHVRSWNTKNKKGFTKTARRKHSNSKNASGTQEYWRIIPNLTPQQAQDKADQLADEISRHELKATLNAPANNDVTVSRSVNITGTGTAWDTAYYVDAIHREYSLTAGYRMVVELKNHPSESQTEA